MLSRTADYALRAAACLASRAPATLTREEVAAATGVPPEYLYKVLQILTRAGIVAALRGIHGGYRLACPPADLSLLDILRAISPPRPAGRVNDRLAAAIAGFEASLAEIRLLDLAATSAPAAPALIVRPPPAPRPARRRTAPRPQAPAPPHDDWAVWTARAG